MIVDDAMLGYDRRKIPKSRINSNADFIADWREPNPLSPLEQSTPAALSSKVCLPRCDGAVSGRQGRRTRGSIPFAAEIVPHVDTRLDGATRY